MRHSLILALSFGLLFACSGDDDNDSTTETDAGVEDSGTEDSGTEDSGTEDSDTEGDTEDSGTEEDVEDTGECDEEQAIRDAIGLIDAVSDGEVTVTEEDGITNVTIDASAGGTDEQVNNPYLYFDFDTNARLDITDIEALENMEWDIAFKRTTIRVNGGDSGPNGCAISIESGATWENATQSDDQNSFIQDDFVDGETCEVTTEAREQIATAFGVWFEFGAGISPISAIYTHYEHTSHAVRKFEIISWSDGVFEVRYAAW